MQKLNDQPELNELRNIRRQLHRFPELAYTEFWTTAQICKYLDDWGIDFQYGEDLYQEIDLGEFNKMLSDRIKDIDQCYEQAARREDSRWLAKQKGGFTGVIARIKGGRPGPKFGFRFDIDGLPITESKEDDHFPAKEGFASTNANMHSCGHDGHAAIGLGLAKRLNDNRNQFAGECYLIFQPAEEVGLGARIFQQFQAVKNLDTIISTHLGIISHRKVITNLQFLASKVFQVEFKGVEAHAANSPHLGKNALLAACNAVTNLYAISRHSDGVSRMGIGRFVADYPSNIVPGKAEFRMELRSEKQEVCDFLLERATSIIKGAAQMHEVEAEIKFEGESITTANSIPLANKIRKAALKAGVSQEDVIDYHIALGSEDAVYLTKTVQKNGGLGTYIGLGSPTRGGHHNPCFDFDEDLLLWGVNILWELVSDY